MKKIRVIAMILFVALGISSGAHELKGARASSLTSMAQEEPLLRNIRGTVKSDGNKLTFVTDDDGKTWDVMNPEMLKGHDGQHVELNVHMYVDRGVIHVHSVKKL